MIDRVRAVIFDVDGTLLHSNDAHAEAFALAMGEHGFSVDQSVVRRLIGKGSDKLLPEAIGVTADSPLGATIVSRKKELFHTRLLPRLGPTPGARALVEELVRRGLDLAVASSAGADELGVLLAQAGVGDLLERRVAADDVGESKPEPDVFVAALAELDAEEHRDRVVVVGDTPYDVESARRAGLQIVALRCGGWRDENLHGAAAIFDDPAHLLRDLDRSPLVQTSR